MVRVLWCVSRPTPARPAARPAVRRHSDRSTLAPFCVRSAANDMVRREAVLDRFSARATPAHPARRVRRTAAIPMVGVGVWILLCQFERTKRELRWCVVVMVVVVGGGGGSRRGWVGWGGGASRGNARDTHPVTGSAVFPFQTVAPPQRFQSGHRCADIGRPGPPDLHQSDTALHGRRGRLPPDRTHARKPW